MLKMRKCITCQLNKSTTMFYADSTHKAGIHPQCKKCNNEVSRQYRRTNAVKVEAYKRRLKQSNPLKYLLINVKARCKRNGIVFDITPADIEQVQTCPMFGIELDYLSTKTKVGMMNDNAATLDRIDPKLGYVRGNVVVLSWRANKLKGDIKPEEMGPVVRYYNHLMLGR